MAPSSKQHARAAFLISARGTHVDTHKPSTRRAAACALAMLHRLPLLAILGTASALQLPPPALKFDFCGYGTNYVKCEGTSPASVPVVLVHGFGGSSGQWRATLKDVALAGRTVYAIDLLGFGDSPKPALDGTGLEYSIELWAQQLQQFVKEVVVAQDGADQAVVVGNSIGSLACVCAAARSPAADSTIAGLGLFNCAIGMNSKAEPLPDDPPAYAFFFALAKPLFVLIDVLLRSPLAGALFDKVRTPETVRSVLEKGVYMNSDRVDDELVNMITRPATDEGALQTFVEILAGDPGPRPEALVGQIDESTPIACWWGPDDQVTPLIGVVGQFFKKLPSERAAAEFTLLPETGHCPFDDRPDIASPALIDWLDRRWPPTA